MEGLADQIRSSLAGQGYDFEVTHNIEWAPPTTPYIDMRIPNPGDDQELAAFGELIGGWLVVVRARVSPADKEAGQALLRALMDDQDPLSIVNAITDPTLNGIAADLHMRSMSGHIPYPAAEGQGGFIGCEWSFVIVKATS